MSRSMGSALLRRNPSGLLLVGGLHVAFLLALIAGLRIHPPRDAPPSLFIRFSAPQPTRPLPPPDVVQPTPLRPTVATSLPPPIVEPSDPALVPREPSASTDVGSGILPRHEAILTGAAIDPRSPLTQPPYPPAALRLGIEGS